MEKKTKGILYTSGIGLFLLVGFGSHYVEQQIKAREAVPEYTITYVVVNEDDGTIEKFAEGTNYREPKVKKGQFAAITDLTEETSLIIPLKGSDNSASETPQMTSAFADLTREDFIWIYNTWFAEPMGPSMIFSPNALLMDLPEGEFRDIVSGALKETPVVIESKYSVRFDPKVVEQWELGKSANDAMDTLGVGRAEGVKYDFSFSCVEQRKIHDKMILNQKMDEALGRDLRWLAQHTYVSSLFTEEPCGFINATPLPVPPNEGGEQVNEGTVQAGFSQ